MPRQIEHVLRQFDRVMNPADRIQIANQPFVVVRVVVNLVGQHAVANHVGMVHAGRGFLLPGGVGVAVQVGEDVAGHVPHVGDAGSRLPAQPARCERPNRLFAIPQMDAIMMRRMHRIDGEHLIQQRIDRLIAGDRNSLGSLGHPFGVDPNLQREKRLGLDVARIVLHDRFQIAHVLAAAARRYRRPQTKRPAIRSRRAREDWRCAFAATALAIISLARLGLLIFACAMPQ